MKTIVLYLYSNTKMRKICKAISSLANEIKRKNSKQNEKPPLQNFVKTGSVEGMASYLRPRMNHLIILKSSTCTLLISTSFSSQMHMVCTLLS